MALLHWVSVYACTCMYVCTCMHTCESLVSDMHVSVCVNVVLTCKW